MILLKKTVPVVFILVLLVLATNNGLTLAVEIEGANVFSQSDEDEWWDTDWKYRQRVNITENNGYPLTNFPVEVTFIHDGCMQPDGADIRIVDNNVEIPYSLMDLNATHATVMFENNIPAETTKSINVYYGNWNTTAKWYRRVSVMMSEGENGEVLIDGNVYIGWDRCKWGPTSNNNNVTLWVDYRIDFNGNNDPTDENDLITDSSSKIGGIGRYYREFVNGTVRSIGLGEYERIIQTPIYVDVCFANASLRVYKHHSWVETIHADNLVLWGDSWSHANYGTGSEENIVDGMYQDNLSFPYALYCSPIDPSWMALRDNTSGKVFSAIGIDIRYNYTLVGQEVAEWKREISFDFDSYQPLNPYDQLNHTRIYWYADNTNNYSDTLALAAILHNPPSVRLVPDATHVPGDVNLDGNVDHRDLLLLAIAYSSTPQDTNWNQCADLNNDNVINYEDLLILAINYGKTDP